VSDVLKLLSHDAVVVTQPVVENGAVYCHSGDCVCVVDSSQSTRLSTGISGTTFSSSREWLHPTSPTMTKMGRVCCLILYSSCTAWHKKS